MAAVCPPSPAGLPRSYVSCKLCVLAGHKSDQEIRLGMQRRFDLSGKKKRK